MLSECFSVYMYLVLITIFLDNRNIFISFGIIYSFIRTADTYYYPGVQISIFQWCLEIGIFSTSLYIRCKSNALGSLTPPFYTAARISITLVSVFLLLCDIVLNPEPNQCCIQMFFGHTVFLKLWIGQFSDRNPKWL